MRRTPFRLITLGICVFLLNLPSGSNLGRKQATILMAAEESEKQNDDRTLLALIQQGDRAAFALLVRRHHAAYYRLACRLLQEHAVAEDIVQTVFLKLWERPYLWQPEQNSKFTTWFYQVVLNACRDWRKRSKPVPLGNDILIIEDKTDQEESLLREETQRLVEMEINRLPERQRTALILCFRENLSNHDAAAIMKINLKALQSLIMRAKQNLKKRMQQYL